MHGMKTRDKARRIREVAYNEDTGTIYYQVTDGTSLVSKHPPVPCIRPRDPGGELRGASSSSPPAAPAPPAEGQGHSHGACPGPPRGPRFFNLSPSISTSFIRRQGGEPIRCGDGLPPALLPNASKSQRKGPAPDFSATPINHSQKYCLNPTWGVNQHEQHFFSLLIFFFNMKFKQFND